MGWPRYKRRMLKRILDGRPVFPIIERWLGGGRVVVRAGRIIGAYILFQKVIWEYEIRLNSEVDYIEVRW